MSAKKKPAGQRRPVLVTTERRGVFFGYTTDDLAADPIRIEQARVVVRWKGTRGFLGLAANGPTRECRISPPAPEQVLRGITSAAVCTEVAAKAFETAPWT